MGITKERVQQMIKTVEGKTVDKVKIRKLSMRRDRYYADLTLTRGEEKVLVSKTYGKDALCSSYAQRVKAQEHK